MFMSFLYGLVYKKRIFFEIIYRLLKFFKNLATMFGWFSNCLILV